MTEHASRPNPEITQSPIDSGDLSRDISISKANKNVKRAGGIIGLSAATILAGAGAVRGQEPSPEPSLIPEIDPLAEFCDIPAAVNSDSQELSNGDIVIFESPAPSESPEASPSTEAEIPEPKNAYELLIALNNKEDYPECDFGLVKNKILEYYQDHPQQAKYLVGILGAPEDIYKAAEDELNNTDLENRNLYSISNGFSALVFSYVNTNDPELPILMEAYIASTNEGNNPEFIENNLQVIEGFKKNLKKIKISTSEENSQSDKELSSKYDLSLDAISLYSSIKAENKKRDDIETVSYKKLSKKVKGLWAEHKESLSVINGIDSREVDNEYFTIWLPMIKSGIHANDPKFIIDQYTKEKKIDNSIRFSSSLARDILALYNKVEDPSVKNAIAETVDWIRNFAITSADPNKKNWKKSMQTFEKYMQEALTLKEDQF